MATKEQIPNIAHICWFNGRLSDVGFLAACMALDQGGFEHVYLWSERGALTIDSRVQYLLDTGHVTLRNYDELHDPGLDEATRPGMAAFLEELDGHMVKIPSGRSDLWRYRILWQEGGVYLDTDALCLRDLTPLRSAQSFVGLEYIAVRFKWWRHGILRGLPGFLWGSCLFWLRYLLSRQVGAVHRFAYVESLYLKVCNGAILGTVAQSPFLARLFKRIGKMSMDQASRLYELGPWLIEDETGGKSDQDVVVHPPTAFYSIGSGICMDYVRPDPKGVMGVTPHPDAYVAHLYDSCLVPFFGGRISLDWLRANRKDTLLGRITNRWLEAVPA